MEEVWDDINLSSLRSEEDTNRTSFRGAIFQDFLARPLDKDPPTAAVSSRFGSPPPPPATLLTLNSSPDQLNFFGNLDSRQLNSSLQPQPNSQTCSENAVSSHGLLGANGNKRFSESDNNSRDRRYKRMMKNRESAVRSRARKQAYTNELELEVANLLEENARLLKQQQQSYLAAVAQRPKKPTLRRTSTAPF
ncbi:unnamed protein product [Fraxinus pennsylvanica]|uniref:BZIP domain-containing protein n=1 Tax=Fraxinus pennsylvanica TaxID=56036 RepID=A0AAD1Z615_9LAMI|nr:unnamed protein product [Fraxinus pennsylvanica]